MVNIIPFLWNIYTNFVVRREQEAKFIYCDFTESPNTRVFNKNKTVKWYISKEVYPFDYFPNYCKGFTYITNYATMKLLYEQSKLIPRLWLDDVFFSWYSAARLCLLAPHAKRCLLCWYSNERLPRSWRWNFRLQRTQDAHNFLWIFVFQDDPTGRSFTNNSIELGYNQGVDFIILYHLVILHTHRGTMENSDFTSFFTNLFGIENQKLIDMGRDLNKNEPNRAFDCILKTRSLLSKNFDDCRVIKTRVWSTE